MRIDVLTLFPELFAPFFHTSILGKAHERGLVAMHAVNFRDFSANKHQIVDDYPYGGGGGMVLKPEPIFAAVESLLPNREAPQPEASGEEPQTAGSRPRVILMCPQGERYSQAKAEELAQAEHLIFICGHYEGYDERIRENLVTDEISIGDYVLTGGEIPAMAVIDSVVRLLPGVLGNERSAVTDSYSTGLLEYPHYTRPPEFRGWKVPDVLLSGHHENIERWRRRQSLYRTWQRRPDLIDEQSLTLEERKWLGEFERERAEEV
ncbi:tRNA (guanosine(37)-N1)-methyltransferase TrmD [Xylanibacillus composti]|uniref:tRNA (guanine-N(1)-)-methyltransferase n=1 Tax=Xylanibacillus composti TaxID=1572762 RepID=A0A8J4M1A3_9BACL|nr:tRNA (guanosine(37)-N1)-methyltransferase TrmD [Xylanibacillus composti]MDT9724120.1 tRNA (guanosine(37)-N1)-methyltransferase TrmD [Xylanibacillus composti]GIQ68670.1 tRNA (guanine-N(1)-)-methyltransferase [Xylanibacillus composti]